MDGTVFTKSYGSLPFNEKEALRYAGYVKPDDNAYELLHKCYDEVKDIFTFKVCYSEFSVENDGELLDLGFCKTESENLKKLLRTSGKCILFAATAGLNIDREIKRYGISDPLKALILQGIGAERVETLCDKFQSEFENTTPRFSPGYGDVPLSMQRDVFQALDCQRKIGLTLNDNLIMVPMKSVTAIFGLKANRETK